MSIKTFTTPSPASARYWANLKDLSDKTKQELIVLLRNSLMHPEDADSSTDACSEDTDRRLDAALAKFSGDFGGDGDARQVARELRENIICDRTIDTW